MGEIVVETEFENPLDRGYFERGLGEESEIRHTTVNAIVDTGAVMLMLPQNYPKSTPGGRFLPDRRYGGVAGHQPRWAGACRPAVPTRSAGRFRRRQRASLVFSINFRTVILVIYAAGSSRSDWRANPPMLRVFAFQVTVIMFVDV